MSKMKITVEQLQQLLAWAGAEPHTELSIERIDGDEGPGLYAFNSDHPEEGAIRLDDGVHSAREGNSVTLPWSPPMLDGPRPPIAGACVAPGRLRATVKHSFESAHDPEDAALRICVAIDAELGLSGNGWFDDDPAVLAAGGTPLRATAGAIDADEISQHLQVKDEPESPPAPPLRSVSIDGVCVKCVGADAERAEREAAARQLMEMMFPDDESDELDIIPTPASGTLH